MGSLGDFCFTRFSGLGQILYNLHTGIADDIHAANMRQDPIAYLSKISFTTIIASAISAVLILLFFIGIPPLTILSYALPSPMLLPLIFAVMPLGVLGVGMSLSQPRGVKQSLRTKSRNPVRIHVYQCDG